MTDITLNAGQQRCMEEILAARKTERSHRLTGYAGSGKTVLTQHIATHLHAAGQKVVLAAPTHKAVAVLSKKLGAARQAIPCSTLHSLLSLRPRVDGDMQVFERVRNARPVDADVVIIDEASMLSLSLLEHVRNYLSRAFVLYVGDPAQLPPVGEVASQAFGVRSHSHLSTIIRQARDNPILTAAHIIRDSQDAIRANGSLDWSWIKPSRAGDMGVFAPNDAEQWMEHAFTSTKAAEDPDYFRYLCWTNAQVHRVNKQIRRWIYGGDTPTPYMPGERIMMRSPAFEPADPNDPSRPRKKFEDEDEDIMTMTTNEEATVISIEPVTFKFPVSPLDGFSGIGDIDAWIAAIPCWNIRLLRDDETTVYINIVRDTRQYDAVIKRMKSEANGNRKRWQDYFRMKGRLPEVQSPYALTVHNSQGSTFRNIFCDVGNIRKRERDNPLEFSQLLYVAATRPTHALVLV